MAFATVAVKCLYIVLRLVSPHSLTCPKHLHKHAFSLERCGGDSVCTPTQLRSECSSPFGSSGPHQQGTCLPPLTFFSLYSPGSKGPPVSREGNHLVT